jgi:hypothetical protein
MKAVKLQTNIECSIWTDARKMETDVHIILAWVLMHYLWEMKFLLPNNVGPKVTVCQ